MFEFKHVNEAEQFLVERLSGDRFLGSAGDGSNSSCFVAPYPPEQQPEAAQMVRALASDLAARGVTAAVADAYDIVLEVLDEDNAWEEFVEYEPEATRQQLIVALRDAADVQDDIVPRMGDLVRREHADLLIVTGMGACYPFLRTHRLLEVLEQRLSPRVPVLVMFPGRQTVRADGSTSLDVLSTPPGQGGGKYRARNVFDL